MRKGRFALLKILIIFIIAGIFWMPVSVFADAETAAAETEGAAPGFREQAMALKRQRENTIPQGVRLDSQNVGGLTKEEAVESMIRYASRCGDSQVIFHVNGQAVVATMRDFRLGFGLQSAVDTALGYGAEGSLIRRYQDQRKAAEEGVTIDANLTYDLEAFQAFVREQCGKFNVPARSAKAYLENGALRIEDGETGLAVMYEEALTEAVEILSGWDGGDVHITVDTRESKPAVSAGDLQNAGTDCLATFETEFKWEDGEERAENLRVACEKINGSAFLAGQEISANGMMEPVTEEGGYHPAHAFQDGKTIDSVGGGICQISSTLYNVGLLAELQMKYRSNHSMLVTYVDPSRDATVYPESGLDLKMINNTGNTVFFAAERSGNKVIISLYGTEYRPAERTIKYVSKTISTEYPEPQMELIYDDSIPVGQYEEVEYLRPKMTAELWKEVYVNGQLTENIQINRSVYNWSKAIRKVHSGCDGNGNPL